MDAVLNVALPVFAIMATGWLAGRVGVLGSHGPETLNRFV
jgi:malonate transporter